LELVVALSDATIADPLTLTVQPQYRTIGIAECVITVQGHPRSMTVMPSEKQYATSY